MKGTIISIIIVIALIGAVTTLGGNKSVSKEVESQLVTEEGGMSVDSQIVEVTARGGYSPRLISAKAGVPMTLRMITNGTYDCSSAFTIPSLKYRTNLPATGVTEIQVPPQAAGSTLQGLCQMGMYSFAIRFN